MPTNTASIIASVITFILVVLLAFFFGFGGIVLLNGLMDASTAVTTGFICLGIGVILCTVLAWMLAKSFIVRLKWNNLPAIAVSVLLSTLIGAGLGFASMMIMIIAADSL